MTYAVNIQGIVVSCEDAQDVLELIRASKSEVAPRRGPGRPPANGQTSKNQKVRADVQSTLTFLRVLHHFGDAGAKTESIVEGMHLKGTRGVGGAMGTIKRVLRSYHFTPDGGVFLIEKGPTGKRWKQGKEFSGALAKLEEVNRTS